MDYLKNIELFNNLSDYEITQLMIGVHFQKKHYTKGDIIVHSGTICESLKIITKGSAHTEMNDFSDKIIKIADIELGQIIAISFVFGNNNRTPVNVIANESTEILFFEKKSLEKMLCANDKVLKSFLSILSNQTQFLAKKIKFLNFSTIKEKMLYYLKEQEKIQKTNIIKLNITQQKLANIFGVTRPSLARAIKEMEKESIVKILSGRKIELLRY